MGAVGVAVAALVATVAQAVALASVLSSSFAHAHAPLGVALWWLVAATLARAVVALVSEPVGVSLAAPVRRDLRRRALRALVVRRGDASSDATVQLLTKGVDAVESYLATYVPALLLSVVAPVVLLSWMVVTDPLSALIVGVTVALLPIFMVLLGLEAKDKMEQRWADQSRLAGYFGDVISGMATLKAHNRSTQAVASLDDASEALTTSTMATLKVAFLSGFALELLASLATALVALVLGLRLMNGSLGLSTALAVLLVTPEVYLPLRKSAAKFHGASDGVGAATHLLDLVDRSREDHGSAPAPTSPPRLTIRDARPVHLARFQHSLDPVNVEVAARALVALEGPSGVGKTTLLRTIAGLDDLAEGVIEVDGVDLRDLNEAEWHACAGWMPQDPVLPGRTVGEVLRAGRTNLSDAQLSDVLTELGLDLDLLQPLGERAGSLSAGQRQRVALARTLLGEPRVLVLDEPTAHLDAHSEALVIAALRRRHVTTIVATHRHLPADHVVTLRAPERFGV